MTDKDYSHVRLIMEKHDNMLREFLSGKRDGWEQQYSEMLYLLSTKLKNALTASGDLEQFKMAKDIQFIFQKPDKNWNELIQKDPSAIPEHCLAIYIMRSLLMYMQIQIPPENTNIRVDGIEVNTWELFEKAYKPLSIKFR